MSNKDRYKTQQEKQDVQQSTESGANSGGSYDGGSVGNDKAADGNAGAAEEQDTTSAETKLEAGGDNSSTESKAGEEDPAAPVKPPVSEVVESILNAAKDNICARVPLLAADVNRLTLEHATGLVDANTTLTDEEKTVVKAELSGLVDTMMKHVVDELVEMEALAASDKAAVEAEEARKAAEAAAAEKATFTTEEAAKLSTDVATMAKDLQEDQLQGEERQKALAAAPSLAQPQAAPVSIAQTEVYAGLSPVAKQVILQLEGYIDEMKIAKPQDPVVGARHQVSLYRNLVRGLNDVDSDFNVFWNLVLAKFQEQGQKGVFDASHTFRFFESITTLPRQEIKQFRNLLNMLRVTASVKSREHALKQFNLQSSIEGLSAIAQERLLGFYGQ